MSAALGALLNASRVPASNAASMRAATVAAEAVESAPSRRSVATGLLKRVLAPVPTASAAKVKGDWTAEDSV